MGRKLRMTAELGDWLTELGGSQPAAAAEVGAALVAVLQSAAPADLAAVSDPVRPQTPDPREMADVVYQQLLEELQRIRRRVAQTASERKRAQLRLASQGEAGEDVAALEQRLGALRRREAGMAQHSQRLQSQVDAFRSAKESAKALYTAAEAELRIADAIAASEGRSSDADLADLNSALGAAEEMLKRVAAQGLETLQLTREQPDQADEPPPGPASERPAPPAQPAPEPAPGLLELRADPLGTDIRILFAVEPADTVTLLAVLEGPDVIREQGAEAIKLASDLLTEIREDGWPADIDAIALADPAAFLARFFPADDGSIGRRAVVLAQTELLSALRDKLKLTVADVAARSGLDADRIVAIEADGLRTAQVHEAVALARALGARLELPAGPGIGALSY